MCTSDGRRGFSVFDSDSFYLFEEHIEYGSVIGLKQTIKKELVSGGALLLS